MKHDRQLLLHGAKRDEVLDLAEVQAYGRDSYGNPDYVCIYGLRPAAWYAKGIRLLGRTAVECTRDEFADLIGRDVAAVAARWHSRHSPLLIDPFAGSGNTLFWLAKHLAVEKGIGFELDPGVFALTARNLESLALPIEVRNVDYRAALQTLSAAPGQLVVAFVAPPWGDALDPVSGLDLRRTYPPVAEIAERIASAFPESPLLLAVQVHETVTEESVPAVTATLDWHELKIHRLLAPGSNHGVLLATSRWNPQA